MHERVEQKVYAVIFLYILNIVLKFDLFDFRRTKTGYDVIHLSNARSMVFWDGSLTD